MLKKLIDKNLYFFYSFPAGLIANFIYISLLFIIVFISKYTILFLPLHIDEMLYVGQAIAVWKNNFNPFIAIKGAYHPPLLYEILALSYTIFGYSIFISHFVTICLSVFCLYAVFTFSSYFIKNRLICTLITLSVFINPIYFTQTGLVQSDIFLTGLILFCLYFYFKKKFWISAAFGTACVITKESGVIFYLTLLINFFIIYIWKKKYVKLLKKYYYLILPFVFFVTWMLFNKILLGFYFDQVITNYFGIKNPFVSFYQTNNLKPIYSENIFQILLDIFWNFNNYYLLITLIFLFFFYIFRKQFILRKEYNSKIIYLLSLVIVLLIFYSSTFYLIRYIILFYILIYVFIGYLLQGYEKLLLLVILFISIFSLYILFFRTYSTIEKSGEINLSYIDVVKAHILSINYIEENFPNSYILTTPTEFRKYIDPAFGYVSKPLLAFDNSSNYYRDNKFNLVIRQNYLSFRYIDNIISDNRSNAHLLKRFQSGPAVVEVYFLKK